MVRRLPALLAAVALGLSLPGCISGNTRPATDVTSTSATLNGAGNPAGVPTTYWFQYGRTTAYGSETPHRDAGSGTQSKNVSEPITGLSPGTTYHFRLVGQQAGGPVYGTDQSFTTPRQGKPMFAIYYLWMDREQWLYRLGSSYPYTQSPSPLPARLDAGGCSPESLYPGNTLTDVSDGLAYDVGKSSVIERDVRLAAGAGLAGFSVNWSGKGTTDQTPTSSAYNQRLQWMFEAVRKVNAEGIPFTLTLNYKTAGHPSVDHIANDLDYFVNRYGSDTALDHSFSRKPEVVWTGSWGYSDAEKSTIAQRLRSRLYLIADDNTGWDANSADNFDGNSWYWPGQNPYKNPASFDQVKALADRVRSTKNPDGSAKVWLAPVAPGYNDILLRGGTFCVPRNDGETMRRVYEGNAASSPNGWLLISWNEVPESTHVVPLSRYGTSSLDTVKSLIAAGQ
jgi:hypothetical protein